MGKGMTIPEQIMEHLEKAGDGLTNLQTESCLEHIKKARVLIKIAGIEEPYKSELIESCDSFVQRIGKMKDKLIDLADAKEQFDEGTQS